MKQVPKHIMLALRRIALQHAGRPLSHVSRFAPGQVLHALKERGMIDATTHDINKMSTELDKPCSVYAGFDPTADSLHVGNLLIMMALAHFQRHGHRPICLVGGATGMIGDPSGKNTERTLLQPEQLQHNARGISENLNHFLKSTSPVESQTNQPLLLNNIDWHGKMSAIDFLRDIGKYFRVGVMLSKDSVKNRLEGDGLSFTEFSYQLLQGSDFHHLYTHHDCKVQLGGSDQWGNITAGCDLVRKKCGAEVFGVTVPLLTTASGEKFGKSAGNAVWLSADKTSPYHVYQYFLNTPDAELPRLLRLFTFMSIADIDALCQQHSLAPHEYAGQKTLASHVTRMLHGDAGVELAQKATAALFSKAGLDASGLSAREWLGVFANLPMTEVPRSEFEAGVNLLDLAVRCKAFDNKVMAGKMVKQGGLYVNNNRITDSDTKLTLKQTLGESLLLLRTGKKSQFLVRIV